MKHSVQIIGAGMAGLLAANVLRRFSPVVHEAQATLPHNHNALLRFRSPAVGDATGIPFQKILVRKGIWDGSAVVNECTIPLANLYSARVVEAYADRSIWHMAPEDRWIAPADFIERMAEGVNIQFSSPVDIGGWSPRATISTLPMPLAMEMTGHAKPDFLHRPIWTVKTQFMDGPPVDLYQTIYNAAPLSKSPMSRWYRATIHRNELTVEFSEEPGDLSVIVSIVECCFAISAGFRPPDVKRQKYGKMLPIDDGTRRQFIYALSEQCNVFSLGRFATWRPILLDAVLQDIKRIEAMMTGGKYTQKLNQHSK